MWKSRVLKQAVHAANGKKFKETGIVPKIATSRAYNAFEDNVEARRKSKLLISAKKFDTR